MFRRVKEDKKETPNSQERPAILTRSKVRQDNKNRKRNSWLNKAIIIVVILLAITIYAVLKL